MSMAAVKHLSRKSSQKRRHSSVYLLKSPGKRPLDEMAVTRGKHMGHLQLQNQPNKKEDNGDKQKGKEKNRNVPWEVENLQDLCE